MDFNKALKNLIEMGKRQIKINDDIIEILNRDLKTLDKMQQKCDEIQENLKQGK